MNSLVRNGCIGLLMGSLLLAHSGCAGHRRAAPPPAPPYTAPDAAIVPTTLRSTPAPATQAVAEPPIAPALATQPTSQPATQPAPATMPVAATEPTEPEPPVVPLPETPPVEPPPAPITTPQAAIDAGLRRMLAGQDAFTSDLVAQLSPADQQLVQIILQGLDAFHSRLATSRSAATTALVDLAIRLRPAEALQIPTLALCSRVEGFGAYDTVAPQQLPAFRESGVVLYCEVQAFASRRQELNWETRLLQQVSLLDAQGQALWRDQPHTVVDLCRKVRRDFYIARIIRLPANLPEGKYTLQVAIEDQLSGQKTQAGLPLQLGQR